MRLGPDTKINDLLMTHDFMVDFLIGLSPRYKLLKNPLARNTVGRVATLAQAASIGGMTADALIEKIAAEISRRGGGQVEIQKTPSVASPMTDPAAKHEMLKEIIRHLHEGGDVGEAKRRFAELVKDVDATEIAAMEQRLIAEGMPQEEVKRLCDVHVQVFKEAIEVKDVPAVEEGHPAHTFMAENRALEKLLARLDDIIRAVGTPFSKEAYGQYGDNLTKLLESVGKIDIHYLRKENQLFPVLEKHDITGPSQVMWSLDDDIRAMIKRCISLHAEHNVEGLMPALQELSRALRDMIYKEEHILFPMAMETLSAEDWEVVRRGEADIGYAWITPTAQRPQSAPPSSAAAGTDAIALDTGRLSSEQINLMLTTLPIDISFVDENDQVCYYSAGKERIFPRSPGVIGRKVQNCHPPKSMPRVQEILDAFRAGTRDAAEFWITLHGRFIHIRYFALRGTAGNYRGCLEVTQDVTGIRALQGERRLLDTA